MRIKAIVATSLFASAGWVYALTPDQIVAARSSGTLKEIYISGSSAQRLYVASWFKQKCNPSTFNVYFNGVGPSPSGTSYRAYACNWMSGGAPILLVKQDMGGSTEGIVPIARPISSQSLQTTMLVDRTCVATGNPIPANDIQAPTFSCNGTISRISDAGISDVEPSLLQEPVNRLSTVPELTPDEIENLDVGFFNETIYGVAVNLKAYRRLQETQGLTKNDDSQNQPSLPRAWIAGALRGTVVGDGGSDTSLRRGWGKVIRVGDGNVENKTVNVCRGVLGSGIQAVSNAYFLNAGCTLNAPGLPALVPGGQITAPEGSSPAPADLSTTGQSSFWLGGDVGNIERCLGSLVEGLAGEAYGIAVLPLGEVARPAGALPSVDKGYRFVKINGISPTRENAKNGAYDFVYMSTMQWNPRVLTDGWKLSFLREMRTSISAPATLNLADPDIQEGAISPTYSYFGALFSQGDPVVKKYATGINRYNSLYIRSPTDGPLHQSCARLRVVK